MQANPSNAHILVIDDSPLERDLLTQTLTNMGHHVTTAASGPEALNQLTHKQFDLILLDLVMPQMDGVTLLSKLKQHPQWQHIPVLIITHRDEIDNIVQCIRMGAVDCLSKPFNHVLLQARVQTSLANKQYHDMQHAYAQELQLRNDALDSFASMVAHDLKNPLSTAIGFIEYIQDNKSDLPLDQLEIYHQSILNCLDKSVQIVDSLLLFARIPNAPLHSTPIDTQILFQVLQIRLNPLIETYQATINWPTSTPLATGHADWVEEVWFNYLSNAIKYGGTPPIITIETDYTDNGYVRFSIKDNGLGLPPHTEQEVFKPLTRFSAQSDGHGLGLSIVQRIITRLGGTVGVNNSPLGCTFWFTLPPYQSS
ncbi:MAG TPA: hybrid sensor histidine kinase/response regulator [Anaerolineae bacterium]|nr:hybrid sensor histidine kinase/response regulator [Anaerolineae bacterium]